MTTTFGVDSEGYIGEFGGSFIPEMLYANVSELQSRYLEIIESDSFQKEYVSLLEQYVGRPSPITEAKNLSEKYGGRILLKREDLNHTGSHKINNALGQVLLAKILGRTRIIAETGAGQHGVATATAAALLGFDCVVFMGEVDVDRQRPNVERMKLLGAQVQSVTSGSKTLKDATNEAMRDWICNPQDTHYVIGSAVGPHPFPDMVGRFQSVISKEMKRQLPNILGNSLPSHLIACVGGGSNALGFFSEYLEDASVSMIGVEAAGCGVNSGCSAATLHLGRSGILHGSKTILMQDIGGQVLEAHSISAGLDYPGIGPHHAYFHESGRVQYVAITDAEALDAALELTRLEGILPALETAHALAYLSKMNISQDDTIVVCLSGRGDKDLENYISYQNKLRGS